MGIGVAIEEGHYTLPRRVEKPRGCNGDVSVTEGAVMAGLQSSLRYPFARSFGGEL